VAGAPPGAAWPAPFKLLWVAVNIAFVTELFSPSIGGQELRYLQLGRHLVRAGHGVSVFTIRLAPEIPSRETLDGIEVYRVVDGFNYLRRGRVTRNPAHIASFTLRTLRSRAALRTYDAVVFNIWPVLTPLVVPRLVELPSVVDWCELRATRAWDMIYRLLANPRVLHVAVSDAVAAQLRDRYRLAPARVRTIVSGVDAGQYRCAAGAKRDRTLLYLGRLSPHKDPMMALGSFLGAGLHGKGYRLILAGDGPLLGEIRRAAAGNASVEVRGSVTEREKIALLQEAALLVLPSKREGFPRVVAEAAAAGTPTLTVRYPENGTAAVVEQYGLGWVTAPDAAQLGAHMERCAVIDAQWSAVSSHCAATAGREFDWASVTAEFLQFVGSHA